MLKMNISYYLKYWKTASMLNKMIIKNMLDAVQMRTAKKLVSQLGYASYDNLLKHCVATSLETIILAEDRNTFI